MTELVRETLEIVDGHVSLVVNDIVAGRVHGTLAHRLAHYEEIKPDSNKIIKPCSRLSTVRGDPQHYAHRKTPKTHVTLTFDL